MTKSKYSRGGLYEQMQTLLRTVDVEDCFLSTMEGKPIVRRFRSKGQGEGRKSRTEQYITTLRELRGNCSEIEECDLVSVDGLGMASTYLCMDCEIKDSWYAGLMSQGNQLIQAVGKKSAEYVRLVGSSVDILLFPLDDKVLILYLNGSDFSEITQLRHSANHCASG